MTIPIRTNKPVFFGDDGEVLKSGYIYIGQPNQDPRSNPKTVTFKDSAGGTFTAAQPLRTNAQGQIAYNGKATIALVDGNYSMLVLDSNQSQIKDGWTPLVEAAATETGGNDVIYRTLLSDLKSVNVTPGQYVENIGKTTALDGEGARWLVVSNTGSPGDDVDLIDFDNGTQGRRVGNQLYAVKALSDVDATSARNNLDVYSKAETYSKSEISTHNSIGTYAIAFYGGSTVLEASDPVNGSDLKYVTAVATTDNFQTSIDRGLWDSSPALSGIWRYMGASKIVSGGASVADRQPSGLFLRIS